MNASDLLRSALRLLRSLPAEVRRFVALVAAGTAVMLAALVVLQPGLIVGYLAACVAVYGPSAGIAYYRLRPGRSDAEDGYSDPDDVDGIELCESCEARPSRRSVVVDGEPFAVCDDCSGPRSVDVKTTLEVVR